MDSNSIQTTNEFITWVFTQVFSFLVYNSSLSHKYILSEVNMNKQNLWFITLFSIILVLSIYYISMPSNILEEYNNSNTNTNETNNSKETVSTINEETSLVALRVAADEELLTKLTNLQNTITDKEKTVMEKNNAYEELMTLNENKGLEENIESKLKEKFSYDSFVKINKDQINIVISSTKHDKMIANSIIKEVQSMFDTKKYITVKFQ